VWLHAASVGETNSVLPLIERLTGEGASVLLTTVTRTSAEIAAQRLPQGAFHQYAPFDAPQLVRRFLTHWQPDLALVVESEIWP
ncbi:glycosyltransferase N-terminal domain-containing protein, partial [Escherichia coli]|nr:glycosyltransferase N-terminal domain-containing protein [Escherichia coli]